MKMPFNLTVLFAEMPDTESLLQLIEDLLTSGMPWNETDISQL